MLHGVLIVPVKSLAGQADSAAAGMQSPAEVGKQLLKPIFRAVASCKNAIYLPAEVRDALVAEMGSCTITWRTSFSSSSYQQLGYEIQVADWVVSLPCRLFLNPGTAVCFVVWVDHGGKVWAWRLKLLGMT